MPANSGRHQRFTALSSAHYADVLAYARRRARGDADAEDVANERRQEAIGRFRSQGLSGRRCASVHPRDVRVDAIRTET